MRGSLRLGRLWGIDVFVHWTFSLLIAWVVFVTLINGGTATMAAMSIALLLAAFACVVLHEYGHALTARRYGISTHDITLLPIGGVARLDRMPEKPVQELAVAVAGPAVNVAIAAVLFGLVWALYGAITLETVFANWFLGNLLAINVILVAFNILPAFPMDGGRVLRALLSMRLGFVRATRIAAAVGQGMALLFGLVALLSKGQFIMLGLVGVFVFLAARGEAQSVAVRSLLNGLAAGDAMLTDFRVLSVHDPLQRAADLLLAGSQQDFPVLDGQRQLQGILRRDDLLRGIREGGTDAPVGFYMQPVTAVVDVREPLTDLVPQLQSRGAATVPVMREGELVGLLTTENITEAVMLREAQNLLDEDGDESESLHEPDVVRDRREPTGLPWRQRLLGHQPLSAGR